MHAYVVEVFHVVAHLPCSIHICLPCRCDLHAVRLLILQICSSSICKRSQCLYAARPLFVRQSIRQERGERPLLATFASAALLHP